MNLNQLSHKWSSKIILIKDKITIEEDFKAVDTDEDGKVTLEEGMKVYELRIPSEGFWEFRLLCLWLLFKISNVENCSELRHGPQQLSGICNSIMNEFSFS